MSGGVKHRACALAERGAEGTCMGVVRGGIRTLRRWSQNWADVSLKSVGMGEPVSVVSSAARLRTCDAWKGMRGI